MMEHIKFHFHFLSINTKTFHVPCTAWGCVHVLFAFVYNQSSCNSTLCGQKMKERSECSFPEKKATATTLRVFFHLLRSISLTKDEPWRVET